MVDMDQGFDTIYVYTDVVESRIVGDSLAPLLRALSVSGSYGATVSVRFTNIHYVPVLHSHFHSIEMVKRNDTGWTNIIPDTRIGRRLHRPRQHDATRAGEGDAS